MDSSTPDQNLNSGNPTGTSIPISNGLGGISPPPSAPSPTPTPSVPSSPMSPLNPMSPLEPTAPTETTASPPEPELTLQPSGGGFKKILPWVIGVIVALAVGGGVYFWLGQEASNAKAELEEQKQESDKQIADLKAQLDESAASEVTSTPATPAATKTDQELITALIKGDCEAEVKLKFFEAKDINIEGAFATVTNGCDLKTRTTTRYNYITAKKVDGTWVIAYEGTTFKPSSTIMAKFGIPASLYD